MGPKLSSTSSLAVTVSNSFKLTSSISPWEVIVEKRFSEDDVPLSFGSISLAASEPVSEASAGASTS